MRLFLLCTAALVACPQAAWAKDEIELGDTGIEFDNGIIELTLGGRLHVDGVMLDDPATDTGAQSAIDVRRARWELSGKIGSDVRFRIDREFARDSKGWRNLWVSLRPHRRIEMTLGNFTVPFGRETLQSSNDMTFAERSLAATLAPDFGLGGSIAVKGKDWTAEVGYFGKALSSEAGSAPERGHGVSVRATAMPYQHRRTRISLGFGAERRELEGGAEIRFAADPGSVFAPTLMSSGTIRDPVFLNSWTGEFAASTGPFLLQAEAIATHVRRREHETAQFAGQNVQLGWMLTGERYEYSDRSGLFTGPRIRRRHIGIELAGRYSRLDLQDDPVQRGIGRALSAGANFYLSRNVRVVTTFTESHVARRLPDSDSDSQVGVVRFQIAY